MTMRDPDDLYDDDYDGDDDGDDGGDGDSNGIFGGGGGGDDDDLDNYDGGSLSPLSAGAMSISASRGGGGGDDNRFAYSRIVAKETEVHFDAMYDFHPGQPPGREADSYACGGVGGTWPVWNGSPQRACGNSVSRLRSKRPNTG